MSEETKGTIKNRQSRDDINIGYTRQGKQTNKIKTQDGELKRCQRAKA